MSNTVEALEVTEETKFVKPDWKNKLDRKTIILVFVAAVLLLVGVILIIVATSKTCPDNSRVIVLSTSKPPTTDKTKGGDSCASSEEANRVQLGDYLTKVKNAYHEVFPEDIAWHPEADHDMIRKQYRIHDPKPANIKRITDRAQALLKEADNMVRTIQFSILSHFIR